MIPIPKSKPKATRDLVLRKATEAWAKEHGTAPLPERFVFAVRGYYRDSMGEVGSVLVAGKAERDDVKPVLAGVAFVMMILRCLCPTRGAGKGFNMRNSTASSSHINNTSGLTSIWVPFLILTVGFTSVFNSSSFNLLRVFQHPLSASFLEFIFVSLIPFTVTGIYCISIFLGPLTTPLFAYFLVPKPVSVNRGQSGFSVFSHRFTRSLPMALFASRRTPVFLSRAFNEIVEVFHKSTLRASFCHA